MPFSNSLRALKTSYLEPRRKRREERSSSQLTVVLACCLLSLLARAEPDCVVCGLRSPCAASTTLNDDKAGALFATINELMNNVQLVSSGGRSRSLPFLAKDLVTGTTRVGQVS